MHNVFNEEMMKRYSRQLIIPEIGIEGQHKLLNAKVLVIGAGGLGSPVLLYLAAAGVGHVGVIDFDVVDMSNLQRQVLYTEGDVGRSKVECALLKLKSVNSLINVEKNESLITIENALNIMEGYDVVIDTSDNFLTRYLANDASYIRKIPLIYGSMFRLEGQVAVFNLTEYSPCYRCFCPAPPPNDMLPNCSAGGALGALAGLIGCLQVTECIKILLGKGKVLSGKIINVNLMELDFVSLDINKSSTCKLCSNNSIRNKLDPEWYEFDNPRAICMKVKEISENDLSKMIIEKNEVVKIIDVREEWEVNLDNNDIDMISIPLSVIEKNPESLIGQISHQEKYIFCCEDGSRSDYVVALIEREFGYTNLYSFKGILKNVFLN